MNSKQTESSFWKFVGGTSFFEPAVQDSLGSLFAWLAELHFNERLGGRPRTWDPILGASLE